MTKRELEQMVKTLVEENQRLQQRITDLERELTKARKTSKTSSKPPSSDMTKPPKASQPPSVFGPRNAGGQPGHPKHERADFAPEELTATREYTLSACPRCGGLLNPAEQAPKVIQQVEIVDVPIQIEEHRGLAFWCPACQTIHYAPFPSAVAEGAYAESNRTPSSARRMAERSVPSPPMTINVSMPFRLSVGSQVARPSPCT